MTSKHYSGRDIRETIKKARELLDKIPERRKECEEAGHHLDYHELSYMITNKSNPLLDRVRGICYHCLTRIDRPLNEKERRRVSDFFDSLHDHVLSSH